MCKPNERIVENGYIIGINTETNQLILIDEPIEYFDDPSFKDSESKDKNLIDIDKNKIYADGIILNNSKKDDDRTQYIKKIKLEKMFYDSFRNIIKILINKYENHSIRNEIKNIIEKENDLLYYDKLEKIIKLLNELCKDNVEFVEHDINIADDIINKIEQQTLCFDNCDKPYCLEKEGDSCKFIIPIKNLITQKDNSIIYYAKIADELTRHNRLRMYILDQYSYLSFSKVIYNISENEIILPQSYITTEYFDNFKNKNILLLNEYIKSNSHDNALLIHDKIQKYDNKVVIDKNIEIKKVEEKKKNTAITFTITNIPETKCFEYVMFNNSEKIGKIFKDSKKRKYKKRNCLCQEFVDIHNEVKKNEAKITIEDVKNTLIELYKNYMQIYGEDMIYNVLKNEGNYLINDINKIIDSNTEKNENKELNNNISNKFMKHITNNTYNLTLLDFLILGNHYDIGILCVYSYNLNKIKGNSIQFIRNKKSENYVVLMKYFRNQNVESDLKPRSPFYFIINKKDNITHSESTIKNESLIPNINIEYIELDTFIKNNNNYKKI